MTALRGGRPDRVPCSPHIIRWIRHHWGCTCPDHQAKLADEFGLDLLIQYAAYTWQSVSNDYVYAPGGGYAFNASALYGDLPEVSVELRVENRPKHVLTYRTFHTPAGELKDVIQWARPDMGYGDGPNPHRLEPLVKSTADLAALRFLYPPPRKDVLADIPLTLERIGERAVVMATDCTHPGCWAMEALGPERMLTASITEPELLQGRLPAGDGPAPPQSAGDARAGDGRCLGKLVPGGLVDRLVSGRFPRVLPPANQRGGGPGARVRRPVRLPGRREDAAHAPVPGRDRRGRDQRAPAARRRRRDSPRGEAANTAGGSPWSEDWTRSTPSTWARPTRCGVPCGRRFSTRPKGAATSSARPRPSPRRRRPRACGPRARRALEYGVYR